MSIADEALRLFDEWFKQLKTHSSSGGPARGTIALALQILEQLKENYNLDLDYYRAAGKGQIRGISPANLAKILESFGEKRGFLKEAGRTNRGGPGDVEALLVVLGKTGLASLATEEREKCLITLQKYLVDRIIEFHSRKRLELTFDPTKSTWHIIHDLLFIAGENGKAGPVAQYLVGAKLQIRFPKIEIGNESYSTADDQLGRHGDFIIGDTVFHITVAPMSAVFAKCKKNIKSGFRTFLLVPDNMLAGARQNAEMAVPGQIAVESIESFVSQNIEELSKFSKPDLLSGLRDLLETYNGRVNTVEVDKSMLIDIPRGLL